MRLLDARSYSTARLRRKLLDRGYSPEDSDATLDRLNASGVLDDERFAWEYARSRLTLAGAAVRRVRQDLARRGIPAAVADRVLSRVVEEEAIDTEAAVEAAARKKLATLHGLEPHVIRRRLYGFLARRGYELDQIRRTVERLT